MKPRVFEGLHAGEGEILMDASQGGCTLSREGVYDFPKKKVIVYISCKITSTIVDSREKVG
jgi:hypothetical protein